MAVALTKRGEFDRAEEALRRAVKLEPTNAEMRELAAQIKKERKDYKENQKAMGKKFFGSTSKKTLFISSIINFLINILWFFPLMILKSLKAMFQRAFAKVGSFFAQIFNYVVSLWIIQTPIKICKACLNFIKKPFQVIGSFVKSLFSLPKRAVKYIYSLLPWPLRFNKSKS
eukprot:TRINITY_DN1717_c0_g2_i1.p1 TRINITY_DN1717_c0_g2~~TRINITY_DN1717_c0_g2_i1.p1  ORF type:complete len:172 (-),score=21.23 TRINITY_DN1717_c0_g2_i1:60-575(-)